MRALEGLEASGFLEKLCPLRLLPSGVSALASCRFRARSRDGSMKIVDLTEFWSERGGGVRTYLTHLLREGPARGHEVTVVTAGPRDETTRVEGGELVRVPGPRQPYDRTYHALVRLGRALDAVRARRPDVVQASSPFLAGWAVARLRGVPVRALVAHADLAGQYLRPALELLVARPSERAIRPAWSYWAALGRRFDTTIVAGPWTAIRTRPSRSAKISSSRDSPATTTCASRSGPTRMRPSRPRSFIQSTRSVPAIWNPPCTVRSAVNERGLGRRYSSSTVGPSLKRVRPRSASSATR